MIKFVPNVDGRKGSVRAFVEFDCKCEQYNIRPFKGSGKYRCSGCKQEVAIRKKVDTPRKCKL